MGSIPAEISGHIILCGAPVWGHLRGLCSIAGKAVRERSDISVTLMFTGGYDERFQAEVRRYIPEKDSDVRARIRLLKIGGGQNLRPGELFGDIFKAFPEYYDKLVRCEPVQSQSNGTTFPGIRSPTLVILDFFLLPVLEAIRARTGKTVPILAWDVENIFMTLRLFGPEELGGIGEVVPKAHALAQKTGQSEDDLIEELSRPMSDALVHIPGLPPMHEYEWFPHPHDVDIKNAPLHNSGYHFVRKCDGFVCISNSTYELEVFKAFRKWLVEIGSLELYVVGPLLPHGFGNAKQGALSGAQAFELAMSENGGETQDFLENIMKTHGKQSLAYIAFGSVWWPPNDTVLLFISVLLELGVPFIISVISPKAHIPPELAQKIKASGIGMTLKWAPQQTIFSHPVTGWAITHCGQNTVMEALAEGLPMIAWPIEADQPANAAHLTLNLDIAFELIEVRSGEAGLKPMYRGTQAKGTPEAVVAEAKKVLQMAKGAEGARKRRNAEKLRDKLRMSWEEGGEALEDMRQLLRLASKNH